jgi:NAD(P)H-flavin reductase
MYEALIPRVATIESIRPETAAGDVKTFVVSIDGLEGTFGHRPGQCAMLSWFGAGECMISITSSPTRGPQLEFAVKSTGRVTGVLHEAEPGQKVGIRGPYGNGFPVEQWYGKRLLFVGGGIGLAPLRSVINYCLDRRELFGAIDIVYGARSPGDLCFKDELFAAWPAAPDARVHLTVDRGDDGWNGPVGFVPPFLAELAPSPEGTVAVTCGPPVMIKLVLGVLERLGFADDQIITTLELKMQCGVGKCGRCNVGSKYVCKDGPVFSLKELKGLPAEY